MRDVALKGKLFEVVRITYIQQTSLQIRLVAGPGEVKDEYNRENTEHKEEDSVVVDAEGKTGTLTKQRLVDEIRSESWGHDGEERGYASANSLGDIEFFRGLAEELLRGHTRRGRSPHGNLRTKHHRTAGIIDVAGARSGSDDSSGRGNSRCRENEGGHVSCRQIEYNYIPWRNEL